LKIYNFLCTGQEIFVELQWRRTLVRYSFIDPPPLKRLTKLRQTLTFHNPALHLTLHSKIKQKWKEHIAGNAC